MAQTYTNEKVYELVYILMDRIQNTLCRGSYKLCKWHKNGLGKPRHGYYKIQPYVEPKRK
jgi:hypothetical protein